MTINLKPLCGHAMAIAVALAFTTGASMTPIGSSPAFALPEEEPKKAAPAKPASEKKTKNAPRRNQRRRNRTLTAILIAAHWNPTHCQMVQT